MVNSLEKSENFAFLQGEKYCWASKQNSAEISGRCEGIFQQSHNWGGKLCIFFRPILCIYIGMVFVHLFDSSLISWRYVERGWFSGRNLQITNHRMIHFLLNGVHTCLYLSFKSKKKNLFLGRYMMVFYIKSQVLELILERSVRRMEC